MKMRILSVLSLSSVFSLLCACQPGTYYPLGGNPCTNYPCQPGQENRSAYFEPCNPNVLYTKPTVGF